MTALLLRVHGAIAHFCGDSYGAHPTNLYIDKSTHDALAAEVWHYAGKPYCPQTFIDGCAMSPMPLRLQKLFGLDVFVLDERHTNHLEVA